MSKQKKNKADKLKKQPTKQKTISTETGVLQEMFFKSKLWKQHVSEITTVDIIC